MPRGWISLIRTGSPPTGGHIGDPRPSSHRPVLQRFSAGRGPPRRRSFSDRYWQRRSIAAPATAGSLPVRQMRAPLQRIRCCSHGPDHSRRPARFASPPGNFPAFCAAFVYRQTGITDGARPCQYAFTNRHLPAGRSSLQRQLHRRLQ